MHFFPTKKEVIPFHSFMDGSYKQKEVAVTPAAYSVLPFTPILGMPGFIQEKIAHAFDPLLEMVQGLAYPLGFLSLSMGFIFIMAGQKSRGMNLIKWAVFGYIGIQFAPAIMDILSEVAQTMAGAMKE